MKKLLLTMFLALFVQQVRPDTVVISNDNRSVLDAEIMRKNKELWNQVRKEMNSETFLFSKTEMARIDRILKELDFDSNDVGITTFFRLHLKETFVTVIAQSGYWFLALDPQWFRKASDEEVKFAMGREFLSIRNALNRSKIDDTLTFISFFSGVIASGIFCMALSHYDAKSEKILCRLNHIDSKKTEALQKDLDILRALSWRQYMEKYMGKNLRRTFDISSGLTLSSLALIYLKIFLDNKEKVLDIDLATRYNCKEGGISFYQRLIDENKTYLNRINYSLDDYLKKFFITKKGNNFLEKGPALTKRIEWLKAL